MSRNVYGNLSNDDVFSSESLNVGLNFSCPLEFIFSHRRDFCSTSEKDVSRRLFNNASVVNLSVQSNCNCIGAF